MELNKILQGDTFQLIKEVPSESIDMVITSPPYWALRDYGIKGQFGLEKSIPEYINKLLGLFDEINRVLKKEGTCWVNISDTYSGGDAASRWNSGNHIPGSGSNKKLMQLARTSASHKFNHKIPKKSLCLIPERFALGMLDRGWLLRNEIIWHKPNAMPQSATDRFSIDFEKLYFFVKQKKYYFEQQKEATKAKVKEHRPDGSWRHKNRGYKSKFGKIYHQGIEQHHGMDILGYPKNRNVRAVWSLSTQSYVGNHFAVYPPRLIKKPILAGCPEGGTVLDPFMGSGTTALVALKYNRKFLGFELNPDYIKMAEARIKPWLNQKRLEEYQNA